MNTPSRFLAAATLATGINACGSTPVKPTQQELDAQSARESAQRLAQIQAAVTACTNAFPTKVAACKSVPDSEYPFEKDMGRNQCIVEARTSLISCLTQAAEPAMKAYDLSNCAAIGTANYICEKVHPGSENTIAREFCLGDIDDARRTCTGDRQKQAE